MSREDPVFKTPKCSMDPFWFSSRGRGHVWTVSKTDNQGRGGTMDGPLTIICFRSSISNSYVECLVSMTRSERQAIY